MNRRFAAPLIVLITIIGGIGQLGYTAEKATPPVPTTLPSQVFIVPNFHPASCGWLANWSVERNYCVNNYLEHLDRVRDDATYSLAISECNNMIAILNFKPDRFAELKQRIGEGRVEPVNAFFLEPEVGLSGGEALAKMGIEGLRWQQAILGVRPRYCWAIDTCGIHDQMPQLCQQLGLDALAYIRCGRSDKNAFWSTSPDGSRILTLNVLSYASNLNGLFSEQKTLTDRTVRGIAGTIATLSAKSPACAPLLILGGHGDYSMPPRWKGNPSEFLTAWKKFCPDCDIRFTGLSPYVDALLPGVKSGKIELPSVRAGTGYAYGSFWINMPRMKSWFRRDEHALQAAEMLATAASLKGNYQYPSQPFYHAWLQMLLNMDRNSFWGAGAGMVFEDPASWDVKDRLEWVERQSASSLQSAARELAGEGSGIVLFNPANWRRDDPLRLKLPPGVSILGTACEAAGDGTVLCHLDVPAAGIVGQEIRSTPPELPHAIELPPVIETRFYFARIDPATGAMVSLKSKPSGREMLSGPANVLIADKQSEKSGDITNVRPKRTRMAGSSEFKTDISAAEGPLAITVEARGGFVGGSSISRVMRFYKNHPRIDFETELTDIPNRTVVFAEFPLKQVPQEIRRGIPFGFSRDDNYVQGIVPAVRWIDYASAGSGGLAILDRGLPGREINGNVPVLYLLNAFDTYSGYDSAWTSGKGRNRLEYAVVVHDEAWPLAPIPRLAWEYNCPVSITSQCRPPAAQSFIQTSDNLVVEAMRRDGADIELRLFECTGMAGNAEVALNLPHENAALTDLTGGHVQKLDGGPVYRFPVRPQQIVTLRFKSARSVAPVEPLTNWDPLVPASKMAALHQYLPDMKGHPPHDIKK